MVLNSFIVKYLFSSYKILNQIPLKFKILRLQIEMQPFFASEPANFRTSIVILIDSYVFFSFMADMSYLATDC